MGSHSVTCHPYSSRSWYSIKRPRRDARLSWPSWLVNWCHWHALSLASVKSRFVLPFWYRLTRVVLDKGPLNGCVWVSPMSDPKQNSGWPTQCVNNLQINNPASQLPDSYYYTCDDDIMVRALDLQLKGHRCKSQPFRFQVTTSNKLFAHVPLWPSSIIWYQSRGCDALQLGW